MTTAISSDMLLLKESAERHGFALPQCRSCAHRFYPPQSWCPQCLAPDVDYPSDPGRGTVLSMTCIHRSLDPTWTDRLPALVACVRTDSGVSLFAMAERALPTGSPVVVRWRDCLFHAYTADNRHDR